MYEGRELRARLAWTMKTAFWVCVAVSGLTLVVPMKFQLALVLVAGLIAVLSIFLDMIKGGRVITCTWKCQNSAHSISPVTLNVFQSSLSHRDCAPLRCHQQVL